jgi:hypothetical protein
VFNPKFAKTAWKSPLRWRDRMEGAGANYLFALATLAMTFAGFCAIVIVLRQAIGKGLSGFHAAD